MQYLLFRPLKRSVLNTWLATQWSSLHTKVSQTQQLFITADTCVKIWTKERGSTIELLSKSKKLQKKPMQICIDCDLHISRNICTILSQKLSENFCPSLHTQSKSKKSNNHKLQEKNTSVLKFIVTMGLRSSASQKTGTNCQASESWTLPQMSSTSSSPQRKLK